MAVSLGGLGVDMEKVNAVSGICLFMLMLELSLSISVYTIQYNLCMNGNLKLGLDHDLRSLARINNFLRGMTQQGVCILQAVVLAKLLAQGFPLNEPTHLFQFH